MIPCLSCGTQFRSTIHQMCTSCCWHFRLCIWLCKVEFIIQTLNQNRLCNFQCFVALINVDFCTDVFLHLSNALHGILSANNQHVIYKTSNQPKFVIPFLIQTGNCTILLISQLIHGSKKQSPKYFCCIFDTRQSPF